jgi:C1A family cysteine protease
MRCFLLCFLLATTFLNISAEYISKVTIDIYSDDDTFYTFDTDIFEETFHLDSLEEYLEYASIFGKTFIDSDDFVNRALIFFENMDFINEHNSEEHNYHLGWTKFTDMTNEEYTASLLSNFEFNTSDCTNLSSHTEPYTSDLDWRQKNVVTPVKNQEFCGSCWAFSTTGALESYVAIKTGKLTSLSEQQLVDCSMQYGNFGCFGGLIDQAFRYTINNNGLCSEIDYPYLDEDSTCISDSCENVPSTNIGNCYNVPANNEYLLGYGISRQPISVAIQANSETFQHYIGGVYDDFDCYTGELDHAVLVVGFNDTDTLPYYIVKNSWGESWGEDGYIYMARNPQGTGPGICGITLYPSFPSY